MEISAEKYIKQAEKYGIYDNYCHCFTLKGSKQILSMSPPSSVHVMFVVKSGSIDLIFNGLSKTAVKNDVYDIFVGCLTIFTSATDDAELEVLILPKSTFRQVFAENLYPLPQYYFVKSFFGPVACENKDMAERITSHLHQLRLLIKTKETPQIRDVKFAILKYIILDVCDISIRTGEVKPRHVSDSLSELTIAFRHLFYPQEAPKRNISWYVERLGVTPQYFSMAIKTATGFSPTQIIDIVVLRSVCIRLFNGCSIDKIVEDFDFADKESLDAFLESQIGKTSSELKHVER